MSDKPKLLIVDDDSTTVKSLERISSAHFSCELASSIAEARLLFMSNHFAVALVDQSLPDGIGLDLLTELQDASPETVRMMITGHIEQASLSKAINDGVLHKLILKPWDNDYLLLQMLEALQSHRLLHEKNSLARLAITDPVTQLNNHRRFQDVLKIEIERATRHGRKLALLMIDIDNFKIFNDKFGHPAGDRLLADVASRIAGSVRTLDTVARYGGEEFAVLMPDTSREDAVKVADRILNAIRNEAYPVSPGPDQPPITVSIGVAELKPDQNLVEEADKALYKAKNTGRNRSVLAD